ncbi:MAG: methyltransferase domain-containing protein [Thermoplasmata archaeon]|nr:MAG: methyltransferase domain-containing protein [Thermoplasmata archaeon]
MVNRVNGNTIPNKLHIGCGHAKRKGYLNLDSAEAVKPDVMWDLNEFPYPFEDNTFDEILAYSILEHLDDLVKVMEELHRIGRPGAVLDITVPYWDSYGFATDPTHKRMFTEDTFDFFTGKSDYGFITKARFKIRRIERHYHPKFRWMPEFLKKRLKFLLKEVVVGLHVTLEVVK